MTTSEQSGRLQKLLFEACATGCGLRGRKLVPVPFRRLDNLMQGDPHVLLRVGQKQAACVGAGAFTVDGIERELQLGSGKRREIDG
jgi:hypothetical protein